MLTPRFGNGDVDQVPGPGQGADPKQPSQVVVQAGFRILKPGQTGAELGLQVQPTGEQKTAARISKNIAPLYRSLLVRMPMVYHQ
jgi:hypothetical protein